MFCGAQKCNYYVWPLEPSTSDVPCLGWIHPSFVVTTADTAVPWHTGLAPGLTVGPRHSSCCAAVGGAILWTSWRSWMCLCHTGEWCWFQAKLQGLSVQFSSVSQSLWLCDPVNCSMPGLPVHHQLPEFTQTHVHWVGNDIQPSYPLSSPSPLPSIKTLIGRYFRV